MPPGHAEPLRDPPGIRKPQAFRGDHGIARARGPAPQAAGFLLAPLQAAPGDFGGRSNPMFSDFRNILSGGLTYHIMTVTDIIYPLVI